MSKTIKYPIVMVKWIDACSKAGWLEKEDVSKWVEDELNNACINIGYLIENTNKGVVVASRLVECGQLGLLQWIPKTCVIKITKLRPIK